MFKAETDYKTISNIISPLSEQTESSVYSLIHEQKEHEAAHLPKHFHPSKSVIGDSISATTHGSLVQHT